MDGDQPLSIVVFRLQRNRQLSSKFWRQIYPSLKELVRFRNQYTLTNKLAIAGITTPLDLIPCGKGYALVMRDNGKISLAQYLQTDCLTLSETLRLAIQLATTLAQLHHQHIVHKDIKPGNLLIDPISKDIELTDFSIAVCLPKDTQVSQQHPQLEGTLAYLAPEQTGRLNRAIDHRTDFYGFGITFYELLTGQLPFQGTDPLTLIHSHLTQYPPAANEVNPEIPAMVAAIASKLIAKNAEDRYQSASGLKHDLEQCLQQWQTQGEVPPFPLGEQDFGDRFIISDQLYGREAEITQLLNALQRVCLGQTELMLVAGFAGIGKTAIIHAMRQPVATQQGYFIQGKFDQVQRHRPLFAFVQALQDLVRQLLSESQGSLAQWKTNILAAAGDNAQLLIEVIPDLEKILGKQPEPTALKGLAARNRFNLTFQKFIEVFTTSAQPLVLFLDDLQWADGASLQLMKVLAQGEGGLLLLGAYRDNEVSTSHGLALTLEAIAATTPVQTLRINPLTEADVNRLVAATLHCSLEDAAPLTQLLHCQAAGNPFFTIQLLKAFYQDGLLQFNPQLGHWVYGLEPLTHGAIATDVVDFMVARLQQLPASTQRILQGAACLGNQFSLVNLASIMACSEAVLASQLGPALQTGLLLQDNSNNCLCEGERFEQDSLPQAPIHQAPIPQAPIPQVPIPQKSTQGLTIHYRFAHDRIQQAAYQLMPAAQRQDLHWQIGQQLFSTSTKNPVLFEQVNHLNLGCPARLTPAERSQLIQLNLTAAKKAKQTTAYDLAIAYGSQALALLGENPWDETYDLALDCANTVTEAAYLTGDFEQVATMTALILKQTSATLLDQIQAYDIQIMTAIAAGRVPEAITIGLTVLGKLGVVLCEGEEATQADFMPALQRVQTELGTRPIASLIDLPRMQDPVILAAMRLLRAIAPAAYAVQPNLYPLIIFRQLLLSLRWGNDAYSGGAYAAYGLLLSAVLDDWETGAEFGRMAIQLIDTFDDQFNAGFVNLINHGFIFPWQTHLKHHIKPLLAAYHQALAVGNPEAASYCLFVHGLYDFLSGTELQQLSRNLLTQRQAIAHLNQAPTLYKVEVIRQVVLNLRENPTNPTALAGDAFDEVAMRPLVEASKDHSIFAYWYLGRMMLAYWLGDYDQAQRHRDAFLQVAASVIGLQIIPVFYFYDSLCQLADMALLSAEEETGRLNIVANNQQKLRAWAIAAPMNMQHKSDLIEAEQHRHAGDKARAIDLYEQAIAGAKRAGYVQEEALANELAAQFYLEWGKDKIAAIYMQEAYYGYGRWGAKTKIKDLESRYRHLLLPILQPQQPSGHLFQPLISLTPTKVASNTHVQLTETRSDRLNEALDLAAILKASQVLSSTIRLDELLCKFTQIILQNSGSSFCALCLPDHDEQLYLRAIATATGAELREEPLAMAEDIPTPLIQQVYRTQDVLSTDSATVTGVNLEDYFQTEVPKSMLCLPLLNQGSLIGIAYLENTVATGVFTPERILILNFLCTQAAIFIQNSLLYTDLEASLQSAQKTSEALTESMALSQGQQDILALIAQGVPLKQILTEIALYIESHSHHEAYCSFLFLRDRKLYDGVAPSLPVEYNELVQGLPIGPKVGSCGTAAHFKASVTVNDILQDPLWADYVGVAKKYGLGACASTPIMGAEGQVLATLAMYQPRPADFTQHDRQLMMAATYLARIAIEKHHADLELRQLNLQVIQGDKMASLGNLVAGVAHEVNNPVGFLRGSINNAKEYLQDLFDYQETYQAEQPPNEVVQEMAEDLDLEFVETDFPKLLDAMDKATDRIAEISNSLRAFSRADKTRKIAVNLHEGLDSTLMILKYRLKATEARPIIAIERDYGSLPKVPCFPGQLNQVFMNILANAIDMFDELAQQSSYKALEADPPKLTIRTAHLTTEQVVEIRIIDNGKGMAEEVQGKIFEHLFTTKQVGKGTGLGLAIAQQIVQENHHGQLTVKSELGQGSEFCLRLPL